MKASQLLRHGGRGNAKVWPLYLEEKGVEGRTEERKKKVKTEEGTEGRRDQGWKEGRKETERQGRRREKGNEGKDGRNALLSRAGHDDLAAAMLHEQRSALFTHDVQKPSEAADHGRGALGPPLGWHVDTLALKWK